MSLELVTVLKQRKVILNVGGKKYTTSIETLTRETDTFFTGFFSGQWQLAIDPNDNSIFIDRNGQIFTHILEWLRTSIVSEKIMQDATLLKSLIIEAEYFRLQGLLEILVNECFPDGTLLQSQHKKILNQFYHKIYQRWELIYKGSRDGFHADAFHSRCDNEGATITIIQSDQNYLFGGYTSVSWTSNGGYKTDPTAFLFTLTNPHNIQPTKYPIKSDKEDEAVCHNSSYGPRFGKGTDISAGNGGTSRHSQYTNFPTTYSDTTEKGDTTFTGAKTFTLLEIEVFKLV
ncbi:unnamed protein product [Rotaria socialis]|nr:unnamed protein product [Rotaria socialis]CAF4566943.1 unnamed protein product [Rotaria socialis]